MTWRKSRRLVSSSDNIRNNLVQGISVCRLFTCSFVHML